MSHGTLNGSTAFARKLSSILTAAVMSFPAMSPLAVEAFACTVPSPPDAAARPEKPVPPEKTACVEAPTKPGCLGWEAYKFNDEVKAFNAKVPAWQKAANAYVTQLNAYVAAANAYAKCEADALR
jgi:hypothetical protein